MTVINGMIPNMFEEVRGFNNETVITEDELVFVDSLKENEATTQFTFGAFCFLCTMAIFTVVILVSTCVLMKRRKVAYDSFVKRQRQREIAGISPSTSITSPTGLYEDSL